MKVEQLSSICQKLDLHLTLFLFHRPSFVSLPWLLPPLPPPNCWEDVALWEDMVLWEDMASWEDTA